MSQFVWQMLLVRSRVEGNEKLLRVTIGKEAAGATSVHRNTTVNIMLEKMEAKK